MSKLVVAHFMLGNTYSYTDEIWVEQMRLAVEVGLDGFSLNLGPEEWQFNQALRAAQLCPSSFKLFLSLDMNVLPSSTSSSASLLASKIINFATHTQLSPGDETALRSGSHQMTRDGKVVVSTFGGGDASFGGIGWKGLLRLVENRGFKVFFVPAFFLPPEKVITDPLVDSTFSWNTAWPVSGSSDISSDEDKPFLKSPMFKKRKPYMAAVSPCFFTHYGTEPPWGWNKNWIYPSDKALYSKRWHQILEFNPEWVQIISWNDYGESHYIGPIAGSQPGSEAWTTGFDHSGFLSLTSHFIRLYKFSNSTRDICSSREGIVIKHLEGGYLEAEQERLVICYRTHKKEGRCRDGDEADKVGRPDRAEQAEDLITVHSILHRPCTLTITVESTSSRSTCSESTLVQRMSLQEGSRYLTVPFSPGRIHFEVSQGSVPGEKIVGRLEGKQIRDEVLDGYNFNLYSAVLPLHSSLVN